MPLSHLSLQDRALFWQFGQGPEVPVPDPLVHRAVERWATAAPHAVAAEHQGTTITYGELNRRADRLAARLVREGVRPGDHVGLFVRRSIPMLVGLLGTLKAGAAYVPQDIGLTPAAQLRHVIRTAGIRVVLTQSEHTLRVPPADTGHRLITLDDDLANRSTEGPVRLERPVRPDDGCYVLFTSGTTGKPNGVKVTHGNVANILLTEPGDLGIRPGDRVAQLLNIAFDMAAWEILGCLAHGGTLVVRGKDVAAAARTADVLIATPTVLSGIDPAGCPHVRTVAVAGEPCPRPLADAWARRSAFHNSCGPTETTIVNTMRHHRVDDALLTIGRPTPNNTVYVLDEHRRALPIGEVGEMWAGGDCVSAGYLNNEALNTERYAPDPFLGGGRRMFRTRDLGRWTPDGELEHLGRTDDQVKVRGFRVELDSVSSVLESVAGCSRAVTLKRDARSLISFVCPADVDPDTARRAVADVLPYYCVPATVHPVAVLPETDRGKVDRAALLRLAAEREEAARHAARAVTVHGEGAPLLPVPAVREGAA
ncbi:amino acid adenylation domain-containing protein [Streptomyces europaeiscabiei]|uniref:amino acid adenylation domain-containing protein n=1 Tax=Streptomyces europaeiscabiei TaxID=146819 RepID=UPI0007658383|nr:amino acid adenylation domain-containing protein [Streptomyces europaeiscabiei]MDX2761913.1 amino acid adenylation domain-containing protein [Streptomyces europaeiscabiei]MDX3665971.1 amino acid adenylation domain-containing protein [Streptomyces europaeiscabiei]MDX3845572.1 amino acid adenylation domain-containing protein [Streptomyces europaeiscabiei]